ncbi:MAG: hypothetical protein AAGF49_09125, partial [Pseudomonadota bacterium]
GLCKHGEGVLLADPVEAVDGFQHASKSSPATAFCRRARMDTGSGTGHILARRQKAVAGEDFDAC